MAQTKLNFIKPEVVTEFVKHVISLIDVVELLVLRLLTFGFFISGVKRIIRHL